MSLETHASVLFRLRGWILASFALLALAAASPRPGLLAVGMSAVAAGCALRCWAFSHLGPQGRTRDPAAPGKRVTSGPYRSFSHPIYLSNLVIAAGLLLCASPPPSVAATLLAAVVVLYGLLGYRESRQLVAVRQVCGGRRMSWQKVARSERSTWLQLVLFQVCVLLQL